jgi:endonuclease III
MTFQEEAKKRYEELLAKREKAQTQLDIVNSELRPLQEYMKSVGLLERKKRTRPQPDPLQG